MVLTPISPSSLNRKQMDNPSITLNTFLKMAESKQTTRTLSSITSDQQVYEDDEHSSPFMTEINIQQEHDITPETIKRPMKRDFTNMTLDLSPSRQLRNEAKPFEICEDEDTQEFKRPNTSINESDSKINDTMDDRIDDSCFSAFSEIPNVDMSKFARFDHQDTDRTPRPSQSKLSYQSITSTPTQKSESDTTNLLIDFTQQFEAISNFSNRINSISKRSPSKTLQLQANGQPQLLSYLNNQRSPRKSMLSNTPLKNNNTNILNLLDFELPPAPTPRSMPSVSIKEMESLKSSYTSQISSLNATLAGRAAEIEALKRAVSDAERRCGESSEKLGEESQKLEIVEKEKEEWERRGREFEVVLKKVKEEILESEREKEEMVAKWEDSEVKTKELESKVIDMENRLRTAEMNQTVTVSESNENLFTSEQVQRQIDEKIHILSTELHAIYKKKHLTKVAGLKKGFEAKTLEATQNLQQRIDELEVQNEELQSKADNTLSGPIPIDREKINEQSAIIEKQKAEILGQNAELQSRQEAYDKVMKELESERIEKGELVAAVDEMLLLQADLNVMNSAGEKQGTVEDVLRKSVQHVRNVNGNVNSNVNANANANANANSGIPPASIKQASIKPPAGNFGFGSSSRIGMIKTSTSSLSSSTSSTTNKSRMMSNIEKMGLGRNGE